MTLRRCLDSLYDAAGLLAALFLVGTLAMVLTGIAGRLLHFHVPGTDAYAGYCMAGCGFLALAHTFTRGEHIRVTLLLEHVGGRAHRVLALAALVIATALAALFLVGTLAMLLAGIAGRLLRFHIPGTDAYAGYFMAGSAFLAASSNPPSGRGSAAGRSRGTAAPAARRISGRGNRSVTSATGQ